MTHEHPFWAKNVKVHTVVGIAMVYCLLWFFFYFKLPAEAGIIGVTVVWLIVSFVITVIGMLLFYET